jgi:hypothetical protein
MPMNDNDELYSPSRLETLLTLVGSGLTLALLGAAGYLAPNLLALAAH